MRGLYCFLAVLACVGLTYRSRVWAAKPAHAAAPLVTHPTVAWGSLVSLKHQRLLIWDDRGDVQVSDGVGKWLPPIKLSFKRIWSIVADPEGFLLSSSTGKEGENDVVALLSLDGHELRRWSPDKMIFGLVSDGRRWARTPAGLRELLPNGGLGETIPFLDEKAGRARDLAVFERDGRRVVCMTADFSKDNGSRSGCKEAVAGGWHFEGMSGSRPLSCGPWLVIIDGVDANRVEVRSFETGKLASRQTYAARPELACTPDGNLLVGQKQLEEVELPSYRRRWSIKVGSQPVRGVAALQDYVAYSVRGSNDVRFVRH